MRIPTAIAFLTLALAAALTSACSEKEASPPPAAASKSLPATCDMSGMDMSKMSAEEHQKMLDDCEKAKSRQ